MTTDVLFDPETGDILIKDGDIVVGDSTDQHTRELILSDKGWYKHTPRAGVGVQNYVNEVGGLPLLMAHIRSELQLDGQNVDVVTLQSEGNIVVQSSYPA